MVRNGDLGNVADSKGDYRTQMPSFIHGTSPAEVESFYPAAVHDDDVLPRGELLLVNGDNLVSLGSNPSSSRRDESSRVRKRVKWSAEEDGLFVEGLRRFGKGRWKDISRHFVKTRTPEQVASHAQKFFLSQSSKVAPSPSPPEQARQAPVFSTDQANGEQTAPSFSSQSDQIEQQADHQVDPPSNPLGSSDQEQDSSNSTTPTSRQEAPLPDMDPTPREKPELDPDQDFFDFASSLSDIIELPTL